MRRTLHVVSSLGPLAVCVLVGNLRGASLSGRVEFDALLWATTHFYRYGEAGLHRNELAFERAAPFVGVTGSVGQVASVRLSADASYMQLQDGYVDLGWANGLHLRAGQFLLPLGFDAMTDPAVLPLATNALLVGYAKPNGSRDIGFLVDWDSAPFNLAIAAVNGSGANSADNNERKDLCGRFAVRPLRGTGLEMAVRGYLGWPGAPDSACETVAGEVALNAGGVLIQSEFQGYRYSDLRNTAAYVLLCYQTGPVEPCGRIEWVAPRGGRPDLMLMGGANSRVITSHVKVALDAFYRRDYQGDWSASGFMFRIQAEI